MAWNDPGVINTEEARLDRVTKDDLLRVARKYLTHVEPQRHHDTPEAQGGGRRSRGEPVMQRTMRMTRAANRNSGIRLLAAAVFIATLPSASLLAQAPGDSKAVSPSKVERKNLAPVSKEILRVKLPKPVEAKLANGLTVLILEDHRFPIVTVDFTIEGAGALWEPATEHGLAGVTAQMLREGTPTRTSKQINEDIDRLGASFFSSAPFGDDSASVGASGLSDNFDTWFPLAVDLMLNANFPDSELAKLKQRLKVQLIQQRQQPSFLATERFDEAVYGNHPAATVAGTPESIDALDDREAGAMAQGTVRAAEYVAGDYGRCRCQVHDCEVE